MKKNTRIFLTLTIFLLSSGYFTFKLFLNSEFPKETDIKKIGMGSLAVCFVLFCTVGFWILSGFSKESMQNMDKKN